MTFRDIKAAARRKVHSTFAVPCLLGPSLSAVALTARFHDRKALGGDINTGEGYANIIEGVLQIVFNREELAAANATPATGARLVLPGYLADGQDLVLMLGERDPYNGPIDENWTVAVNGV